MTQTIRHRIISAMAARAAIIRTANGFSCELGASVLVGVFPLSGNSIVIWPGDDEIANDAYGKCLHTMPVVVEAVSDLGDSAPSDVLEPVLGDLIEAFTGNEIYQAFTNGSTEISVGDTVVGATSAASGYVGAVSLISGSWAGGDAAGTLTLRRVSGEFLSGESIKVGSTAVAVAGSWTGSTPEALCCASLADSIRAGAGGAGTFPEPGRERVGARARFDVKYKTVRGNPYAQ